jgi:hypothetical protein
VDSQFLKNRDTAVNLDMNSKQITGLGQDLSDLCDDTQAMSWHQVRDFVFNIVNAKRVKNNVGFIPQMYGFRAKNGFIISTNTQLNNNTPAKSIFIDGGSEWSTAGMQENSWVQIQLPFKVSI